MFLYVHDHILKLCEQWRRGGGAKGGGAYALGGTVQGRHLEGQKYKILKFYTPNLAYCLQSALMPSL